MIREKTRKFLAGTIIGIYFMAYTAPAGFCLPPIPNINDSKPVLRTHATSSKSISPSHGSSILKLEGDISITKNPSKINLSLRNSDVQQVLRMFADKAGLNIVFHNSVKGKVTLDLVNVSLNDAFKLVMQVNNLTYYVDHNTMVVMDAKAAQGMSLSKKEMASIPVKYVNASNIALFLNQNIFSSNQPGLTNANIAVTNPATNEVLVFGTDNDVLMARKIIAKFDVPPRETQFVVNHTTPKEMSKQLCKVLFPSSEMKGSGTSSSSSSSNDSSDSSSNSNDNNDSSSDSSDSNDNSNDNSTGGASNIFDQVASIAGHATGGA